MLRMAALLCLLTLGLLAPASAQGATTLVGDYRFDGRLAASDGPGAPLTELGPDASTFATENVGGTDQTVLRFPNGNGVRFTTPAPIADYSIVVQFRLEELSGWRRVMDMSSRTQDRGLYLLDGQLQFFPFPVGPTTIGPNEWVEVAMTRDSAGLVTWYVNGAFEATRSDTSAPYFAKLTDSVNFFVDDFLFGGEMSGGAVARIRVFDGVLTAHEVRDLPRGPVDGDGDGVVDGSDNCPTDANADQSDLDGDDTGDACDADIDGDGVANDDDNAPRHANPGQEDVDEDGIGDVIDPSVAPATAELCRREGWRRFSHDGASFRNQGDCVSFVATRGRNLPAG